MQWREYVLKCRGYQKLQERKWDEIRVMTYITHSHLASRPRPFEQWLKLTDNEGSQYERLKKKLQEHRNGTGTT